MDLPTNVGERHLSSGCRDRVRELSQQCHARIVSARVIFGCYGLFGVQTVFGGSGVLADTYVENYESEYTRELVEYPILDLRLLKRCLKKVSSSVFAFLDPFSMSEFLVTRLKGAEHRDGMMSRSGLRRAIITREVSTLSLLEVVGIIVSVWPLIVIYLKETGRKTDGDN